MDSKVDVDVLHDHARRRGVDIADLVAMISPDPDDILYVSGSLTDGLGNADSDLDIFWLTSESRFATLQARFDAERESQQRLQKFGILYLSHAGMEFDIEVRSAATVTGLIGQFNALDWRSMDCVMRNFRFIGTWDRVDALEIMHRLRIGVPIFNPAGFDALARSFGHRDFCNWYGQLNLELARETQKGIRRSLRDADPENAFLKLSFLYDLLVDAALFLHGDSIDRWKWRLAKARRTLDAAWCDDYLDVRLHRRAAQPLEAFVQSFADRAQIRQQQLEQRLADAAAGDRSAAA